MLNVYHLSEGEAYVAPATFVCNVPAGFSAKQGRVLGFKGKVKWSQKGDKITVQKPKVALDYATAIQLDGK